MMIADWVKGTLPRRCANGFLLALTVFCLSLHPARAAAPPDKAAARVQVFYAALLASMKAGRTAGVKGRYDMLRGPVDATFDIPLITKFSVGPSWDKIAPAKRRQLIAAFRHMTIANYAKNFDSYGGESFEVAPKSVSRGGYRYVRTRMIRPGDKPIIFNYLMSKVGDGWKILDVYYTGTVSELARRRSEFSTTIRQGGADFLLKKLHEMGDRIMTESKTPP